MSNDKRRLVLIQEAVSSTVGLYSFWALVRRLVWQATHLAWSTAA
jgi:hypothetical protein